jgi:hypothetical protein
MLASTNIIFPVSAATGDPPPAIETFSFNPEWGIDVSDSFSSTLGALGMGVSFSFSYSFDAGVSLPVVIQVVHPEYVLPNSTSIANISAYGDDSARAWLYASGSFDASLDAGIAGSFSLASGSVNVGDEISFTTPVGTQDTELLTADMLLGSQTINLLLVQYTVELRLAITSSVTASTSLTSHLNMSGDALQTPVDNDLEWTAEGEPVQVPFSVSDQTGTYIDMDFDDVTLHLTSLIFNILSFTVYLVINSSTLASVTIPLPAFDFIFAEDKSQVQEERSFQPLADASGTTRDLGSCQLSIHVGVPFRAPIFLSSGFLIMIIPAAVGAAYGKKQYEGSKAVGSVLMLAVLLGAALNSGLSLSLQSGIGFFLASWVTLIFPVYNFTGDVLSMVVFYLPWILAGIAVGGGTKKPKAGAALGLGIPLTLYFATGFLVGGMSTMMLFLYSGFTVNVLIASSISAVLGGAIGYAFRNGSN